MATPRPKATRAVKDGKGSLVSASPTAVRRAHREELLQRLAAVVRFSDDAIFSTDLEGRINSWNPAAQRIFGYSPEQALEHPLRVLFPPEAQAEYDRILERIRAGEHVSRYETTVLRRNRQRISAALTISPIHLRLRGRVTGASIIARDITEQREAEEKLRTSEAFYHSLVESLPQFIFRKDLEHRITFANQRHCQTLGLPLKDIIGKTDYDFYPPELAAKYQADDQKVIESGETFETVEVNQPPGGKKIYVHVCKTPIRDADGKIIGIQGIFWDITASREAEDALRQANAELSASRDQLMQALEDLHRSHEELKAAQMLLIRAEKMETVGRLAAGVAHEVKNPLAIMLSGIEYLEQTPAAHDGTMGLVLKDMREALSRADSVIRGLLDFAAAQELGVQPENLNEVIERPLALLRHDCAKAEVTVVKELAADLPLVPVDRNKMEQVFLNLFLNAIQAMPQGGRLTVRTRVRLVSAAEVASDHGTRGSDRLRMGARQVVVEVEDTGTGIPEEMMAKLFEPFFTTKPTGKGTGLGLAVSKKILEMHGADISIKNRAEGGIRVTITLRA